ncbi:helix-turn-helix domain-containing protein [Clostridium ljungdahlii]|uniref:Helix-turn-helix domain protein n=1 Tax=Clostridium ljungdahlii TaxID=1538 RepID=A0A170NJW3_9CLOT|nr:helix-turn-helix domain-containing protein [Clostridium ljungdahlii]OAA90313.1 Helix-turn-helix domain protein [Clostridium ljungdahlii]
MNNEILNLEQAIKFLGVSEKTLIKLLREEHIPARKIGREWRFSKEALINWVACGDSINYINKNEMYSITKDIPGSSTALFSDISQALSTLKEGDRNIKCILDDIDKDIVIPENAVLRISYKQQRDIEKLQFKIFWNLREDYKLEPTQKEIPSY